MVITACCLIILFVTACGEKDGSTNQNSIDQTIRPNPNAQEPTRTAAVSQNRGVQVSASQYGTNWPYTVSEGFLDCEGGNALVFRAENEIYALNGFALQRGYPAARDTIRKPDPSTGLPMLDTDLTEIARSRC